MLNIIMCIQLSSFLLLYPPPPSQHTNKERAKEEG